MPEGPWEFLVLHRDLSIFCRLGRLFGPILRSLTPPIAIFLLFSAGGCWDTPQKRLMGHWRGQPDSAAAWMERKAESDAARREKAGLPPIVSRDVPIEPNVQSPEEPATQLTADLKAFGDGRQSTIHAAQAPVTDWEKLGFDIDLRFLPKKKIRMSLGGEQEVDGTWEVIVRSRDRVTIEIRTESPAPVGTATQPNSGADPSGLEIRRFVIRFEGKEKDRFTLQEEGADPDVGSLLFHRVKE